MSIERHIIRTPLRVRYGAPPFSILDARQGYWQDRKRWWTRKGLRSELGRGEQLIAMSKSNMTYMFGKKQYDIDQLQKEGILLSDEEVKSGGDSKGTARTYNIRDKATWNADKAAKDLRAIPGGGTGKNSAWLHKKEDGSTGAALKDEDAFQNRATGTSIFDPVLTELMFNWFCPDNGSILDPFCGGSVRGIVAAHGNHEYSGMELRADQVQANRIQGLEILGGTDYPMPNWVVGDALDIQEKIGLTVKGIGQWDFIFSCPPYGDLEVYSEDQRDLSTMEHHEFLDTYRTIIQRSVEMLKPNRFAAFVVGDFRNEEGFYRNFVSDTIDAFQSAGAQLYNECILITVAGSLPIRVHKQFANNRKLGKTHQNVLIFFKGDPKTIKDDFTYIDIEDKTEDLEWL